MEDKLIPLSEDLDNTTQEVRDLMYENLTIKGAEGAIPSLDMESLAELILTIPDRSGMNGWTLIPAIAIDGERCVFKIAGWILNNGMPPPSNVYLGYAGLVSDITEAINIRGRDGLTTDITINGKKYSQINGNIFLPDLLPTSHNISPTAHGDIRATVSALQTLLESDDTTLDELQEIVNYIKDNRELIESITVNKVSVSDIVDNLESNDAKKPLSGNMGRELNAKIGKKQDQGDYATVSYVDTKISEIEMPDVTGDIGTHNLSKIAHNDIRLKITELYNTKQEKGNYILENDPRLSDARPAAGGNSDTVDGKHASDLQDYNNLSNKPNIPTSLPANGGNSDTTKGVLFNQYPEFNVNNIFANPPLNSLPQGVHYFSFDGLNIPGAPIQGAGWWHVTIEMMYPHRVYQKAIQVFNIGATQRMWYRMRHIDNDDFSLWQPWREILNDNDKYGNRSLWDTMKGHYIITDMSNPNIIYEKIYTTEGNVLKAELTTILGDTITETLGIIGISSTTKTTIFEGNIIRETIT